MIFALFNHPKSIIKFYLEFMFEFQNKMKHCCVIPQFLGLQFFFTLYFYVLQVCISKNYTLKTLLRSLSLYIYIDLGLEMQLIRNLCLRLRVFIITHESHIKKLLKSCGRFVCHFVKNLKQILLLFQKSDFSKIRLRVLPKNVGFSRSYRIIRI